MTATAFNAYMNALPHPVQILVVIGAYVVGYLIGLFLLRLIKPYL